MVWDNAEWNQNFLEMGTEELDSVFVRRAKKVFRKLTIYVNLIEI